MSDLITFVDSAYAMTHPPATGGVAFYIGDAYNVWTTEQVDAQPARYRLPIWVKAGGGAGGGENDAKACLAKLVKYRVPVGALVALDVETDVDKPYVTAFGDYLAAHRYPVIVYGSRSSVFLNDWHQYWAADWTGEPHMVSGASMTQYAGQLGNDTYDLSVADPTLPFWDTHAHPAPKPTQAPAMPHEVTAAAISATQIMIRWAVVPGADSYPWRITYQDEVIRQGITASVATDVVDGLEPDHTYTVHLAARNAAGTSSETNGPSVKTLR